MPRGDGDGRRDDGPLGSARDEAERLVATALAAASIASRSVRRSRDRTSDEPGLDDLARLAGTASRFVGGWVGAGGRSSGRSGYGRSADSVWTAARERADRAAAREAGASGRHLATGSDACCSCPVCRAIEFVREPSPDLVERLASGASDLASAATAMLRAFSDVTGVGRRGAPAPYRAESSSAESSSTVFPSTGVDPVVPPDFPEPELVEPELVADDGTVLERAAGTPNLDEPGASEPAHTVPPTAGRTGAGFSSVWQAATRAPMTEPPRRAPKTPKPMAKKSVRAPIDLPPVTPAESGATPPAEGPTAPVAKKATKSGANAAEAAKTANAAEAAKTANAAKVAKTAKAAKVAKTAKAAKVAKAAGTTKAGKAAKATKAAKAAKAPTKSAAKAPAKQAKAGPSTSAKPARTSPADGSARRTPRKAGPGSSATG
jgi:hypothetical protein